MEERQTLRQATKLWQEAYRYQMEGELDRAIERYQRSIEAHPTAEAHTFLGWTLSFQGRLEEATEECLRAIAIDPEFGNPHNDIGGYLMQRPKQAKRYEPRRFPFMNLGQIYLRQGRWWEALHEFEGAVRLVPRDHDAAKMLHHVRARLN
jgi:tetratricopeptide (TPR) repeat protein